MLYLTILDRTLVEIHMNVNQIIKGGFLKEMAKDESKKI